MSDSKDCATGCCVPGGLATQDIVQHPVGGPSASEIAATQEAFKADASKAQASFTTTSTLTHGLHTVVRLGQHTLHVDEPEALGGTDTGIIKHNNTLIHKQLHSRDIYIYVYITLKTHNFHVIILVILCVGPNPVELILIALGTCQEITYKAYANALGLTLKSASAEVDGKLDLRGFYGVSPYETARPGFSAVSANVTLELDATAEQIETLKGAVATACPVKDIIENKVPLTTSVTTVNSEASTNTGGPSAADIQGAQATFTADASAAQAAFKSISKLKYGLATVARVSDGKHTVHVDEPAALGGGDTGPNPVELVLAALGTCQEITYKAYSNALGIPLRSAKATVTGDLDLRGFYGVSPYEEARPGFKQITVNVELDTPASAEQIETLKGAVAAHCPVKDILENKVPLTTTAVTL